MASECRNIAGCWGGSRAFWQQDVAECGGNSRVLAQSASARVFRGNRLLCGSRVFGGSRMVRSCTVWEQQVLGNIRMLVEMIRGYSTLGHWGRGAGGELVQLDIYNTGTYIRNNPQINFFVKKKTNKK